MYEHVDTVEEFVQMLKPFHLIEALNICLGDYDRRLLHKTYVILQKLHNHLVAKFCADDLKHHCGNYCINQDNSNKSTQNEDIYPHTLNNSVMDSVGLGDREEVISKILVEDKYSLMAHNFKGNNANPIRKTCHDQKHVTRNESSSIKQIEYSAFKTKHLTESCTSKFLHRVRFEINFKFRLKEFDEYCEERNSLDSVLDDIIHSVGEGNVLDGIDCF